MISYEEHTNVQPEDWPEFKPMPERHTVLYPKLCFKPDEMVKIRRGFYPTVMEQKWFLYFTVRPAAHAPELDGHPDHRRGFCL